MTLLESDSTYACTGMWGRSKNALDAAPLVPKAFPSVADFFPDSLRSLWTGGSFRSKTDISHQCCLALPIRCPDLSSRPGRDVEQAGTTKKNVPPKSPEPNRILDPLLETPGGLIFGGSYFDRPRAQKIKIKIEVPKIFPLSLN